MAGNEKTASAARKSVLRDVRAALGEMFGGGKLDARQEVSVEVLFGLLGVLSRADGVVSDIEAHFTNELMEELNLSTSARKLATEAFGRGSHKKLGVDAEMKRLLATFPRGSSEVDSIYEGLLRMAAVDGTIRRGERMFLDQVTTGLGFAPGELDTRLKKVMPA
jgi:DnaJ like chaperone protein